MFVDRYFSLRFPDWRRSVSLWSSALDRSFGLLSRPLHLPPIGRRLLPKLPGKTKGIDLEAFPPRSFVAGLVERAVVAPAERHGELVADFDTQSARLRETQMVGVARLPSANEAWL